MTERPKAVWPVEIHDRFEKKLARLARPERGNILKTLEKLPDDPVVLDLKSPRGRTDWRFRVGVWRILANGRRRTSYSCS